MINFGCDELVQGRTLTSQLVNRAQEIRVELPQKVQNWSRGL